MAEQMSSAENRDAFPVPNPSQVPPIQIEAEAWAPSKQVKLIIVGQLVVVFVVAIDLTILTATLPAVTKALGATAVESFWIAASYLLANAVVQPIMAALADIFGRRPSFFTALLLFTVGTIVCCTAKSVGAMLAGRITQGIGGGGILSINLIIFSDLIPLRQRSKYIGLVLMVSALGLNVAPIIGAALLNSTWRWLFVSPTGRLAYPLTIAECPTVHQFPILWHRTCHCPAPVEIRVSQDYRASETCDSRLGGLAVLHVWYDNLPGRYQLGR